MNIAETVHGRDELFTSSIPVFYKEQKPLANESVVIQSFSYTHKGNVREDNQDAVQLCDSNKVFAPDVGYLYGIADGMGGFAHGGVASTLALETFFETFYSAGNASPLQKFKVGIQNANLSVYQEARRLAAGRMGTTLTAVNIVGRAMHIGHIGDSRAYLIRDRQSRCLTNDHTRVAELVRMRMLAPDKIRTHSQRSVLEKCLGLELFIQPDIFTVPVQEDDIIILCTDGIWALIDDHEFADITHQIDDPEKLCEHIATVALERQSDDNVSIVVLYLKKLSSYEPKMKASKPWSIPGLLKRLIK